MEPDFAEWCTIIDLQMPPEKWQLIHKKERLEMNKTKRHLWLLMLVLALLAIPTFVVFAKELGALTITGPGIKGELTVSDSNFTLEKSGFFDQAVLSKVPENLDLDAGYSITAHLNLDGKIVPFAQIVYYATEEGQPAYLHYTGRLEGQTLQTVDEWNSLSRSADGALRNLLTANKVTVQSALIRATVKVEPPAKAPVVSAADAEVAAVPVTAPAPVQGFYVILAVIAAILIAGAGLMIRRRTM